METYIDGEISKLRKLFEGKINYFDDTLMNHIGDIQALVKKQNNHQTSFVNGIKDEVEFTHESQRKMNLETLNHIKGLSSTLRKIRDQQLMFADENMKFKEMMTAIVSQLNNTVCYLNSQTQEVDGENHETIPDDYGP